MKENKFRMKAAALALFTSFLTPQLHAQEQVEEADLDSLLETIVVTAQFIEQDAQDIPIAVTALSGDLLDARGQDNTTMIGAQAPSVQLQAGAASQGNSLIAFIRGIGQQDNAPTLEPGVGIYVDDVYFNNVQGSALDLLDIDRIEILRGPQGTLAGKNSIGGAIKIYSKRPDEDRDGYLEASAGNFDAVKIRGGSNFTLAEDELYLRLSGRYNERDGYVQNYDFDCIYVDGGSRSDCEDGTLGGVESKGARAALRWLPSDSLEINLGMDFIDDTSEPAANILSSTSPSLAPIFTGIPGASPLAWNWFNPGPAADPSLPPANLVPVLPAAIDPCVYITTKDSTPCAALVALGGPILNDGYSAFTGFNNAFTGFSVPRENSVETTNINLNIDWAINDDLQLQSITALREYDVFYGTDDDASPVPVTTQTNTQEHTAFSQEFRLNGRASDSLSYTVGAYFQDTETEIGGNIDLGSSGVWFLVDDLVETTSYAIFSNVIWSISDQLEFAGGLRYSDDEKTYEFDRLNQDGSSPDACPVIGGQIVIIPNSNCLVGGVNDIEPQVFSDDRVDYRLALSYLPTDDITVYGSVATGYKAGGANSRSFFAQQALPHDSEELTSYEIGAKFDLFSKTLRLNTAIFTNDYEDVIATLFDCTAVTGEPFGSPCFLPANLGTAEVSGFEFEFDWAVTEDLYIDGSYSYVDFKYTEGGAAITTDTIQAYTPETTWSLGAQYDINTSFGTIAPRVDIVYQDDLYNQPENTQLSFVEDYTLVNASIRWTSPDELWVVALEGKNLTDKYYLYSATDQTASGYGAAGPAIPRNYMFTVRRNFF
jgi:iron complex outermembrane receptor protein